MDFQHLSSFELRQICYFMVLVQAGNNFSEAAKQLGIKQPPFSQRIQALEEKLSAGKKPIEVKLLDRSTQPAALTEAGKVFLEEAQLALIHLERAIIQSRRASQGQIGHLIVGIHNSVANGILPKVLEEFQKQFPTVELELREVTIKQEIQLLKDHQIDVVFHRLPSSHEDDSDLSFMPILQETFLLVLPVDHHLAQQEQVSLAALKNEPIILPSLEVLPFYQHVILLCREAGFEPKIVETIKATGIVTLLSLVATKIGVAILPSHVQVLHREGVVYRPIQGKTLTRQMVVAWRQDDASIVLQKFLDVIQAISQSTQASELLVRAGAIE